MLWCASYTTTVHSAAERRAARTSSERRARTGNTAVVATTACVFQDVVNMQTLHDFMFHTFQSHFKMLVRQARSVAFRAVRCQVTRFDGLLKSGAAVPVPDETEQGATEFAAVMREADTPKRKRPSHRWSMYSQVC